MAKRKTSDNYYLHSGLKERKSGKREDTEAGRLAAYIIDRIPEGYDVYEDHDINEVHLAEAIVAICGRYIRYCPQIGWMVYQAADGRWTKRYAESAVERVIKHFGYLLLEGSMKTRREEETFARKILTSAGLSAIKKILKNDVVITIEQERFDADPDLLNCKGDMYNLRTGESRPVEPEDLFSKSTMCKAAALQHLAGQGGWEMPEVPKKFEDFMRKITSKDGVDRSDLSLYILFYFGYCLTGDNGASFFVNFHGQGKNGKSVLLNLMLELFGDYAAPLPRDVVIENRFQSQFDLAVLPGIRLGVLADAPKGQLNMDMLKSITSGESINAKRKYLDDFKFNPVCKIAVGSNPKLKLNETGMAIQRRIRMVPFDYTVPDEELITNLHRHLLKAEAPEILSLLIYFAHEYYLNGEGPKAFPTCAIVDEASAEYMKSQDLVGRWKEERTENVESAAESSADLYQDFKKWVEAEGVHKVMSRNTFGDHLTAHVPNKKRIDSKWHYLDIRLKEKPGTLPQDRGG